MSDRRFRALLAETGRQVEGPLKDEARRSRAREARLEEALRNLLRYAERQTCAHEETHRGGAIWTICDCCGKQWADDRGGFVPYQEPQELTKAAAALSEST